MDRRNRGLLASVAAVLLVAMVAGAVRWGRARAIGADAASTPVPSAFDQAFQRLTHFDPSLPAVIATVKGAPLSSADYQNRLNPPNNCVRYGGCLTAAQFRTLGPENVALTQAVDDLLIEQYGTSHGIVVTPAEVTAAIQQEVDTYRTLLMPGSAYAAGTRALLAAEHISDPSELLTSARDRELWHGWILINKTESTLVYGGLAQQLRLPDAIRQAKLADFEAKLQARATVKVNIPAHLVDPHILAQLALVTPTPQQLQQMIQSQAGGPSSGSPIVHITHTSPGVHVIQTSPGSPAHLPGTPVAIP